MPPALAAVVFAVGVAILMYFDRDTTATPSKALWLPTIWMGLAGSRMVSQWLELAAPLESAAQAGDGNVLDRYVLIGLMLAGILVLAQRSRRTVALLRANLPILMFFYYAGCSVLWSDYLDVASKRWLKSLGDLVMIMVVVTDRDPGAAMKQLLARIGFLLVPASVLFIKYFPELGRSYSAMTGKARYTGVTMDKNMLGVICIVAGLGCVWRLIGLWKAQRTRAPGRRGMIFAQVALLLMVLWLLRIANSMTSLACFLLGASFMLMLTVSGVPRRRAIVHALVIGALGVTCAAVLFDAGGAVQMVGRDPTLTGRTELWDTLLSFNVDPFFGAGFESFWLGDRLQTLWAKYWWRPSEAHNGYLEVYLNLGAVGVVLLALVVVTGYRNVMRGLDDEGTGGLRLGIFVASLAFGLTEAAFRVLSPVWMLFLWAAMAGPRVVETSRGALGCPVQDGRPHTRPLYRKTAVAP